MSLVSRNSEFDFTTIFYMMCVIYFLKLRACTDRETNERWDAEEWGEGKREGVHYQNICWSISIYLSIFLTIGMCANQTVSYHLLSLLTGLLGRPLRPSAWTHLSSRCDAGRWAWGSSWCHGSRLPYLLLSGPSDATTRLTHQMTAKSPGTWWHRDPLRRRRRDHDDHRRRWWRRWRRRRGLDAIVNRGQWRRWTISSVVTKQSLLTKYEAKLCSVAVPLKPSKTEDQTLPL